MSNRHTLVRACLLSGVACLAFSGTAYAQEADLLDDQASTDNTAELENEGGLNTIIVTANKRAESVQEVPISVAAVSGESLASKGLFEVEAVQQATPGLFIAPTGNTTQTIVRIRGIGTSGTNNGFESAVGAFVDGVFRPRAGQALGDLLDVERVEVLRGPQGTLFGKNTSAGAISIITNSPEFDFGGALSASYGNFDAVRIAGHVTGPVSDSIAFRLSGSYSKRDGTVDKLLPNTGPNPTRIENFFNDRDRYAIKGQVLLEPTPNLSIKIIADYAELDEIGNIGMPLTTAPSGFLGVASGFLGIPQGTPLGSIGLPDLAGFVQPDFAIDTRQAQYNTDPFENTRDGGVLGEITYDFGWGELKSITAWRDYDTDRSFDLDQVGADILGPLIESASLETITQEFQLTGDTGRLRWLVGAFLFDEQIDFATEITLASQFAEYVGLGLPPGAFAGQGLDQVGSQENRGFAIFTQNTFEVTNRLELTAGLRFNYSEKRGISILNGAAPETPSVSDPFCAAIGRTLLQSLCFNRSIDRSRDETEFTGTAKAFYRISDDVNVYASYSRGYKAGGINLDRESLDDTDGVITDLTEFEPEFVDAFEVGLKGEFFDRTLRLNVAGYYSDISGFQLNSFNGVSFTVINAEQVINKGIEVDAVLAPIDGITLNASAAYNITRFADDLGDNPLATRFEGLTLPSAPEWQLNAGIDFDKEMTGSGLRLVANANVSYISEYNAGSQGDPSQEAPGYALANGSIGVRTLDDRFGLRFAVNNIFDLTRSVFINPTIFQVNQPGQTPGRSSYLNQPRFVTFVADVKF